MTLFLISYSLVIFLLIRWMFTHSYYKETKSTGKN